MTMTSFFYYIIKLYITQWFYKKISAQLIFCLITFSHKTPIEISYKTNSIKPQNFVPEPIKFKQKNPTNPNTIIRQKKKQYKKSRKRNFFRSYNTFVENCKVHIHGHHVAVIDRRVKRKNLDDFKKNVLFSYLYWIYNLRLTVYLYVSF